MKNQLSPPSSTTHITKKQFAILLLLYRYRFLNRLHIQLLLNHTHAHRIKAWLKDLTEKQLITRIYTPTFGTTAQPAIYYLARKSRPLLKQHSACHKEILNRVYTERVRSERFRTHCMTVANLFLYFHSVTKNTSQTLSFYTSTDLAALDYVPSTFFDAYIAIKTPRTKTTRSFATIIDEHTPRFVLRVMLQQWHQYFDDGTWQDHTNQPFPQILLVCPNMSMHTYLTRLINEAYSDDPALSFLLTTTAYIQHVQSMPDVWHDPHSS